MNIYLPVSISKPSISSTVSMHSRSFIGFFFFASFNQFWVQIRASTILGDSELRNKSKTCPPRTKSRLGCNCRDRNSQHITGNLGKDSVSRRIHFPPHQDVKIFHIKVLRRFQQIPIQLRFAFHTVLVCQVLLKLIIITFNTIRQ